MSGALAVFLQKWSVAEVFNVDFLVSCQLFLLFTIFCLLSHRLQEEHYFQETRKLTNFFEYSGKNNIRTLLLTRIINSLVVLLLVSGSYHFLFYEHKAKCILLQYTQNHITLKSCM